MHHSHKMDYQDLQYHGIQYRRHTTDRSDFTRGTVLLFDKNQQKTCRRISSFPHINRVYRLEQGVKRVFKNQSFFVEEKLDGYNVRIFSHQNQLLAVSRGGFVCPFTTEWADTWAARYNLYDFFSCYPEYVLCVEVTGDNPYNFQRDPELGRGAHMFVFDLMDENGKFLDLEKKYQLIEEFSLPAVSRYGKYNPEQMNDLFQLVRDLNEKSREGIIMKSPQLDKVLKFVNPNSDIADIKDSLRTMFDLTPGYFRNRFLRTVMFIQEFNLDRDEYARRIGYAFINGLDSLQFFNNASETFVIYVRDYQTWKETRGIIQDRVDVEVDSVEDAQVQGHDMTKIKFRRIYEKSTHRFHNMLKGFTHTD